MKKISILLDQDDVMNILSMIANVPIRGDESIDAMVKLRTIMRNAAVAIKEMPPDGTGNSPAN